MEKSGGEILVSGPLVSVILPVKNGERFLDAAINSVLRQDYENYEIIVVDGKSTDKSETIARSYQGVRFIEQTDEGFGNALNAGIRLATGELIAFNSFDDLWMPNKLSLQVECFKRHPEIQYVITGVRYFLEDGEIVPSGFRRELLSEDRAGYMPETLMVRKALFGRIGVFSSDMKISADVDWFARAKDFCIPMMVIPEVLVHKRVHGSNSTLASDQVRVINHEILKSLKHSIDRQKDSGVLKEEADER